MVEMIGTMPGKRDLSFTRSIGLGVPVADLTIFGEHKNELGTLNTDDNDPSKYNRI